MRLIKTFAAVLALVLAFPSVAVAGNTDLTRGDIALRHVEFINDHLYGRITFTYRELETTQWIVQELAAMGHDPENITVQEFYFDYQQLWFSPRGRLFHMAAFSDEPFCMEAAADIIREMLLESGLPESMEREIREYIAKNFPAALGNMIFDAVLNEIVDSVLDDELERTLYLLQQFDVFGEQDFRNVSQNVILTVPGQSSQTIIAAAHYDSVKFSGASDNASGMALMLESAYHMLALDNYYTIVYVFFGGHELGLLGGYYFLDSLSQQAQDEILFIINADVLFEGPYLFFGTGILEDDYIGENEISERIANIALYVNESADTELIFEAELARMPGEQRLFLDEGHTVLAFSGFARVEPDNQYTSHSFSQETSIGLVGGRVLHTPRDDFHYIEYNWPGKMETALRTFSVFLENVLTARFTELS